MVVRSCAVIEALPESVRKTSTHYMLFRFAFNHMRFCLPVFYIQNSLDPLIKRAIKVDCSFVVFLLHARLLPRLRRNVSRKCTKNLYGNKRLAFLSQSKEIMTCLKMNSQSLKILPCSKYSFLFSKKILPVLNMKKMSAQRGKLQLSTTASKTP